MASNTLAHLTQKATCSFCSVQKHHQLFPLSRGVLSLLFVLVCLIKFTVIWFTIRRERIRSSELCCPWGQQYHFWVRQKLKLWWCVTSKDQCLPSVRQRRRQSSTGTQEGLTRLVDIYWPRGWGWAYGRKHRMALLDSPERHHANFCHQAPTQSQTLTCLRNVIASFGCSAS